MCLEVRDNQSVCERSQGVFCPMFVCPFNSLLTGEGILSFIRPGLAQAANTKLSKTGIICSSRDKNCDKFFLSMIYALSVGPRVIDVRIYELRLQSAQYYRIIFMTHHITIQNLQSFLILIICGQFCFKFYI